jgi:hypothetical protein
MGGKWISFVWPVVLACLVVGCSSSSEPANNTAGAVDAGQDAPNSEPDSGQGGAGGAGGSNGASGAAGQATMPLDPLFFDNHVQADDVFQLSSPDPKVIDVDALLALLAHAENQESDSVLIAYNNTIIAEKHFFGSTGPHSIQSITKSVTSLAIGKLIETGKIPTEDTPISTWYPEWNVEPKAQVTLFHLLTHTSGMTDDGSELFTTKYPNKLSYARQKDLSYPPGTTYSYSNVGTMLLSGIIEQVSGVKADKFVEQSLFGPMGINNWSWTKDPSGNVMTPGGLFMIPRDLLRLGKLGLDKGKWNNTNLIQESWLGASSQAQTDLFPCYGYLWWLVREGCGANGVVGPISPTIDGYYALGWGGNYVVVLPALHLIAVRTKEPAPNATYEEEQKTAYPDFPNDVKSLIHLPFEYQ